MTSAQLMSNVNVEHPETHIVSVPGHLPKSKKRRKVHAERKRVEIAIFDARDEISKISDWNPHHCCDSQFTQLFDITQATSSELALIQLVKSVLISSCRLCTHNPSSSMHMAAALQFITQSRINEGRKFIEARPMSDPQLHLW